MTTASVQLTRYQSTNALGDEELDVHSIDNFILIKTISLYKRHVNTSGTYHITLECCKCYNVIKINFHQVNQYTVASYCNFAVFATTSGIYPQNFTSASAITIAYFIKVKLSYFQTRSR